MVKQAWFYDIFDEDDPTVVSGGHLTPRNPDPFLGPSYAPGGSRLVRTFEVDGCDHDCSDAYGGVMCSDCWQKILQAYRPWLDEYAGRRDGKP